MRGDLYIDKKALWDCQHGVPATITSTSIEGVDATGSIASDCGIAIDVLAAVAGTNVKCAYHDNMVQINGGTCLRIPVISTEDSLTVVSSPGYNHYTIGGEASTSDNQEYTPTAADVTQGYVEIIATSKSYLYSISLTQCTDTWVTWGVGLEDGALDALMTFRPNKEPITNKNVTAQGAVVVCGTGLVDERTVSVPIHIVARNKVDFLSKREAFYQAIQKGKIVLRVENPVQVSYEMYYNSCSQYTQFMIGVAKFILSLYEPNTPAI